MSVNQVDDEALDLLTKHPHILDSVLSLDKSIVSRIVDTPNTLKGLISYGDEAFKLLSSNPKDAVEIISIAAKLGDLPALPKSFIDLLAKLPPPPQSVKVLLRVFQKPMV